MSSPRVADGCLSADPTDDDHEFRDRHQSVRPIELTHLPLSGNPRELGHILGGMVLPLNVGSGREGEQGGIGGTFPRFERAAFDLSVVRYQSDADVAGWAERLAR